MCSPADVGAALDGVSCGSTEAEGGAERTVTAPLLTGQYMCHSATCGSHCTPAACVVQLMLGRGVR